MKKILIALFFILISSTAIADIKVKVDKKLNLDLRTEHQN